MVASAYGWPYHLHVTTALKSGSLNLLEPSKPAQAWNGIALPLLIKGIVLDSDKYIFPSYTPFFVASPSIRGNKVTIIW